MLQSLTSARPHLDPYHETFVVAMKDAMAAWTRFVRKSPELALPLDATTRANFIHNHAARNIQKALDGASGADYADGLGFAAVRVGPLLVRFKYVAGGKPTNVATTQQKLLANQHFTEEMVGALVLGESLSAPTLVTCGYTINGEVIGRVEIRCDCRGHQPWSYDIYGGNALAEPTVIEGLQDTARPAIIRKVDPKRKKASDNGASQSA